MLDGLPRNRYVLQTPHRPPSAGNDTSRKVSFLPPSARQMFAFQHFSSPFGASLTCTLRPGRGRGMWCGTFRHTHSIPLAEQRKV
ncbi:hypothetical protein TNIN_134731 [Trichonephila inaurata madagascariensis]|uniref:Uncharacterized protein n=1 Tax=Trichonephila inaurata madagascariensis TaxID=2747483 RepID=A0A8X7CID1_9ARAC|nr:hypothetical protein TNIN_134731 [Trichonephila inaurata madagascariensis]